MPVELKVPEVGESITEVEIGEWKKAVGDRVAQDEVLALLETDKVSVEVTSPTAGILSRIIVAQGSPAKVGQVIGLVESSATAVEAPPQGVPRGAIPNSPGVPVIESPPPVTRQTPEPEAAPLLPPPSAEEPKKARDTRPPAGFARVMPSARRVLRERGLTAEEIPPSGPGGRLLKEDVLRHELQPHVLSSRLPDAPEPQESSARSQREEIVPMSPMRKRIAERLLEAQQGSALLTTFNEVDMFEVMALRKQYQESFTAKYKVKLGFMSFFVKATVEALKLFPQVNAEIRGSDLIFKNYYDIGVAIGGGKGLVVPILRGAERLGFSEIELAIAELSARAKENKLKITELQGGTFTISNGGVYGSMLSTPIINPPQSGILGLHAIQDRAVVRNGQIVIRPMMYLALTYDHRIVDGREAVTFLKHVKDCVENPTRILLEL